MNTKLKTKASLAFLLLTILTTACSSFMSDSGPSNPIETTDLISEVGEPGDIVRDIEVESLMTAPVIEVPSAYESTGGMEGDDTSRPKSVGESGIAHDAAEVVPPSEEDRDIAIEQQYNLRAGSVDDNQQWDDYLLYRLHFADNYIRVHDIDVTERHIFRVTNGQGFPVLGARISIRNQQGELLDELMTYSDGTALFFPKAYDPEERHFTVDVEKDGVIETIFMGRNVREHPIVLNVRPAPKPVRLDVHFLIDTTGSMSDEIHQLRNNMITISERIHALPSNPDVRFSMTTYRDRRDTFVSKTFDFTPDIELFIQELNQVYADGGGDYPESLNEGLHDAIHLPEWRTEETISLIFLIADAPPHLDYPDDYDYAEEVLEATERGIKIFPLASSGLDDQGEYIFRQLAQITSAKFLFLTYGAEGMPGNETSHHVDDYSVLSLDQLVVRIVEEELANLNGQEPYTQ